jgi:hypothetical protein
MGEQIKVEFGEQAEVPTTVSQAMGSFDYVTRKLWVRVDELEAGTDPVAVGGFILKDQPTLKIQQFKDDGFKWLDGWIKGMESMLLVVKKSRDLLASQFLTLQDTAKAASQGRLDAKKFKDALVKQTRDIEETLLTIEKQVGATVFTGK